MNRRSFLSLSALTAVHGQLASELVAAILDGDVNLLTTIQTTHGTDIVVASLSDRKARTQLRRWMRDGETAILRVNAAGILAKSPDDDFSAPVAQVLHSDDQVRHLYSAAVISRTCGFDWTRAVKLAIDPLSMPSKAAFIGSRLSAEVLNPRDSGARWCSASLLRDLSPQLGLRE